MYCPHSIVYNGNRLMVTRHESGDYCGSPVPLGERLNILRYSITLWPGTDRHKTFNRNGRLNLLWANLNWHLWKKHLRRVRP